MTTTTLAPCPFCGDGTLEPVARETDPHGMGNPSHNRYWPAMMCSCGADVDFDGEFESEAEALTEAARLWNQRPLLDAGAGVAN